MLDERRAAAELIESLREAGGTQSGARSALDASFRFEPGPLFHQLVLADEINRAPAKVQSALLEAMAERQVTVGRHTHALPEPFLVLATQNPIEHEGTYPLPEAQLDRFLMHVRIAPPPPEVERRIVALAREEAIAALVGHGPGGRALALSPQPLLGAADVLAARRAVLALYLAPELEDYIVRLVAATRDPAATSPGWRGAVRFGASPRASIALDRCARARAWLAGRDHVSPADIQALAPDVLRHRVLLGYEALAQGRVVDDLVADLLGGVMLP